ncbi:MAG: hypothetical protein ACP5QR_04920 [Rhizomicrobium sp.]
MGLLLQNNILAASEKKIESSLTPQNRLNYERVVVAGMKVALQNGPKGILASLRNSKNPVEDAAKGAVGLCVMLYKESRGTMPLKAMIPAGVTLMLNALDFASKLGLVKITTQTVVQATHIYTNTLFQALGITPQMLQTAAQNIQGLTQDPVTMEKINRAAGVVKDPRASTPTPLPPSNQQSPDAEEDE